MKHVFIFFLFFACLNAFGQTAVEAQPDEIPEFPGGSDAMMKFISSNLKLPASAAKDTTFNWCKALVTFTIDEEGNVKFPAIVRECIHCQDCDKEALRVIEMMPKWKPGRKNGKAVPVKQALPIFFSRKA